MAELKPIAEKAWRYCEAQGISGKTVTVKTKYPDFTQATRSRTGTVPFANAASGLLAIVYPLKRSVRLLGVKLSSLTNAQPRAATEGQPPLDLNL
jgi:DNA polymerase-4